MPRYAMIVKFGLFGSLISLPMAFMWNPLENPARAAIQNSQGEQAAGGLRVARLRCEYRRDPLGIEVTQPRLTWEVVAAEPSVRGRRQTAYEVIVARSIERLRQQEGDLWNSGKVQSDRTVHVAYQGKPLKSRTRCYWKVRVWDERDRVSTWSEPAMWSMGLPAESDWQAEWTGADWHGNWQKGDAPPLPWIRKRFVLSAEPKAAVAYVAVCGYYELYINGRRVDDHVLSPAVSDYSKRALYVTHDVKDYLVEGTNCLALWLGRGWYTKSLPGVVHDGPLVRAQVEVPLADGRTMCVASDASWKVRPSPITPLGGSYWGNHGGEHYDASRDLNGWNTAELDDAGWEPAKVFRPHPAALTAQIAPPNRIQQTLRPVSVEQLPDGAYLIDVGRHLAGWFSLTLDGSDIAGSKIRLEYVDRRVPESSQPTMIEKAASDSEKLAEQRASDPRLVTYNQRDEYTVGGRQRETFCSRFNYHGFRWVKVTGLKRRPNLEDARAYLIQTDYPGVAEFECSDELLNQIYEAVIWTYRCLSLGGYVSDCPHRERFGYGDGQASLETALCNFGQGALLTNWMVDWRDGQNPRTGEMPNTAPSPRQGEGGGPAWGGICITLPWQLYLHYDDLRVLEASYPAIQKWLAFLAAKEKNGLLAPYLCANQQSMDWSFLGDWNPPGRGMLPDERVDDRSTYFFNNCYYIYSLQLASRIAAVLGKDEDALAYGERAETLKSTVHRQFFNPNSSTYVNGEQPYLAFPLLTGVVPKRGQAAVEANLERAIQVTQDGHLNSGILGTYFLLKYLTAQNRSDLIFEMANQRTFPGWGYMMDKGATTIWEQWHGDDAQIHSSFLSIGAWFIQGLGGIRVDENAPGFKHFFVKPAVVGDMTFARAEYRSIRGKIGTRWQVDSGRLSLEVTVPANTTATVYVPTNDPSGVTESGKPAEQSAGVKLLRTESGRSVYLVESGQYCFRSMLR